MASSTARAHRRGVGSLEPALVALGVTLAALVAVETLLVAVSASRPVWVNLLFPATAVVYATAGLAAWLRRPANRFGALLVFGSMVWLAASLYNVDPPALVAVGLITQTVAVGLVVHLLLAFPSGRLPDLPSRLTCAAAYVMVTVFEAPLYLFAAAPSPYDVLTIADRPDLVHAGHLVQRNGTYLAVIITGVILLRRMRRADRAQRRVVLPLFGYGSVAVLLIPLTANFAVPRVGVNPVVVTQVALLAGVPLAFFWSLQRGAFLPTGGVEQLAVWLSGEDGSRPDLTAALAGTLGDPSLQLHLREGPEVPAAVNGRGLVEITLGERRIGSITYDATLIDDPEPVRQAGRVVTLALDRERLTNDLIASRARIAQAGDLERRRIAADLHDGLQATLVMLALRAYAIEEQSVEEPIRLAAGQLRQGMNDAADTLRQLVHGVMPTLLIERGLFLAAEDLVDRMPLPTRLTIDGTDAGLPDHVQSAAYFALAEALTNAVKHAAADRVEVTLRRDHDTLLVEILDDGVGGAAPGSAGSGLRSLADRLDAVGGHLRVTSDVGRGTVLTAELPCAS